MTCMPSHERSLVPTSPPASLESYCREARSQLRELAPNKLIEGEMAAHESHSTGRPTPQRASLGRVTVNAKPQSARSSFSPGLGPVPGVPPPSVEVVASERRKGRVVRPEDWGYDGKDYVGVLSQSVYRPQ